jgi:hypothetical protein
MYVRIPYASRPGSDFEPGSRDLAEAQWPRLEVNSSDQLQVSIPKADPAAFSLTRAWQPFSYGRMASGAARLKSTLMSEDLLNENARGCVGAVMKQKSAR